METKYTKGPWEVGREGFGTPDYVYADDSAGSAVAKCKLEYSLLPKEQVEANKKLIAASPELLEAIEAALRIVDLWGVGQYGTTTPSEMVEAEMQALASMEKTLRSAYKKATE